MTPLDLESLRAVANAAQDVPPPRFKNTLSHADWQLCKEFHEHFTPALCLELLATIDNLRVATADAGIRDAEITALKAENERRVIENARLNDHAVKLQEDLLSVQSRLADATAALAAAKELLKEILPIVENQLPGLKLWPERARTALATLAQGERSETYGGGEG